MNTLTREDLDKHRVVKYVGTDSRLEAGRLYGAPLNLAPVLPGVDRSEQEPRYRLWSHTAKDYVPVTPDELTAPDPVSLYSRSEGESTLTVLSSARHRNGVGGEPFVVALVAWDSPYYGQRTMLVTMFPTQYTTAVMDVNVAAAGDIGFGFGENSFRGDQFDDALRPILYADSDQSA